MNAAHPEAPPCPLALPAPQVLTPARHWHQQLLEEGEDVFGGEAAEAMAKA